MSGLIALLAITGDCNDDRDQAKWRARRGALFRGTTLAFGPTLVRRLYEQDIAKSRPLRRVRAAREIRGRHPLRPRRLAGRKARGVMFRKGLMTYADGQL